MKDLFDFIKSFDLHTIIVVGIAFWWLNSGMNQKFDTIKDDISEVKTEMAVMKTEMAVIKTVLIMKNVMPSELAKSENGK